MYVHICTYTMNTYICIHGVLICVCSVYMYIIYKVYDVIYSVYESLMYSVHYMKT